MIARRDRVYALAAPALANTAVSPLLLGFLYNGPKNDLGYNQAHAEGKASLAGNPGVRAVEESNVPETGAAEETMRNMIHQDGAVGVFATSVRYLDSVP